MVLFKPRILFSLFALLLLVSSPFKHDLRADAFGCPGINSPIVSKGYGQTTVSSTAVALSGVAGQMAIVMVESAAIRYRTDGTAPTASVGIPIQPDSGFVLCGANMNTFRAIRQSSDAKLNYEFFGS